VALALAVLAVTTVLLRLPFMAPRLAHWDAVNYALGLHRFDIAAHQPHPPGSPYFILLGRAALAVTADDNAALLAVTLAASVGAVLGEYLLARRLFGPRAGLLAALVLMTQPVFWGYGTTATAWTMLACLAVAVGLMCLLLVQSRRLVYPSALLMGVASGFRLDVTCFLAPLWLWALTRVEPSWRRRLAAVALVVLGVVVWLVPVVAGAGGFDAWLARLLSLFPSAQTARDSEARQLAANTAISFGTLAFTLGPLVAVSLVANWRSTLRAMRDSVMSDMGAYWGLWILPAFTFLWLVDSTEPGHDLIFIPALVALGVGWLRRAAPAARRLAVCGACVVGAQSAVFLFGAPQYDRPLVWTADSMLLNVTAPGLRSQQASLESALETIREHFSPDDTVIVTLLGQDPYRFMMYYLPEYTVVRLDPDSQSVLAARARVEGNWTQPTPCLFAAGLDAPSASVHHAVWVISDAATAPETAANLSVADNRAFQVWDLQPEPNTPDYLGFELGGTCASVPSRLGPRSGTPAMD
jgi:4-amino-4-deoxy-L-arabinose transferase-like glycosyltransferase